MDDTSPNLASLFIEYFAFSLTWFVTLSVTDDLYSIDNRLYVLIFVGYTFAYMTQILV